MMQQADDQLFRTGPVREKPVSTLQIDVREEEPTTRLEWVHLLGRCL